jgi:Mg-chelatase subunit ChlD
MRTYSVIMSILAVLACLSLTTCGVLETATGHVKEEIQKDDSEGVKAPGTETDTKAASGEDSSDIKTKEGLAGKDEEAAAAAESGEGAKKTGLSEPEEPSGVEPEVGARSEAAESRSRATSVSRTSTSGLKASFADDNKQFNYFMSFLKQYDHVEHYSMNVQERLIFTVTDAGGKSLPNTTVRVYAGSGLLEEGKTYADGTYLFFPSEHAENFSSYRVRVSYNQNVSESLVARDGSRRVAFSFNQRRPDYRNVALDILFILDTTGSMGEEIERLKTTIEIINLNLISLSSAPRLRFGMVLYKDRGDEEYVTRVVPLTSNLEEFREHLDHVYAAGGGDTPEDLQSALEDAMKRIQWNKDGIRLGFIITDAPPHLSTYRAKYTYVDASKDARRGAIKLFSVGTGGLNLMGEYILRQISQYTYAKYIFLTYGETGESEGGAPGSVSHHTGANYQTDRLEAIVIRFAKEELSHLTDQPLEEGEEYFQAVRIDEEKREETLQKLFALNLSQLADYSTYRLREGTPTAALPIVPSEASLNLNAEYFYDQLTQSLAQNPIFRGVERKDFQKILAELEFGLSDLADESKAPRIGSMLGAQILVTGKLYQRAKTYELFMKLLRVETGEILSASIAKIDVKLGLE